MTADRITPLEATDARWELLGLQAQAVMAELRRSPGRAVIEHDLHAVLALTVTLVKRSEVTTEFVVLARR